jgi:hypothetical protein
MREFREELRLLVVGIVDVFRGELDLHTSEGSSSPDLIEESRINVNDTRDVEARQYAQFCLWIDRGQSREC